MSSVGFRSHDQMCRAGNVFRFGERRTCTLLRRPCRKARSEGSPVLPAIQSLALNKEQISFPRGRRDFASGVSVGGSGQRASADPATARRFQGDARPRVLRGREKADLPGCCRDFPRDDELRHTGRARALQKKVVVHADLRRRRQPARHEDVNRKLRRRR